MSNAKKDFYDVAELTRCFVKTIPELKDRSDFMAAAMLAQAQQLAVISGHLADIAACLETIAGKAKANVS